MKDVFGHSVPAFGQVLILWFRHWTSGYSLILCQSTWSNSHRDSASFENAWFKIVSERPIALWFARQKSFGNDEVTCFRHILLVWIAKNGLFTTRVPSSNYLKDVHVKRKYFICIEKPRKCNTQVHGLKYRSISISKNCLHAWRKFW